MQTKLGWLFQKPSMSFGHSVCNLCHLSLQNIIPSKTVKSQYSYHYKRFKRENIQYLGSLFPYTDTYYLMRLPHVKADGCLLHAENSRNSSADFFYGKQDTCSCSYNWNLEFKNIYVKFKTKRIQNNQKNKSIHL